MSRVFGLQLVSIQPVILDWEYCASLLKGHLPRSNKHKYFWITSLLKCYTGNYVCPNERRQSKDICYKNTLTLEISGIKRFLNAQNPFVWNHATVKIIS